MAYITYTLTALPVCSVVSDQAFVTAWTVACFGQASLSVGLSRQEYWSGLPFPSPGDLPNPGIEPVYPVSPALQVDSLRLILLNANYHTVNSLLNIMDVQ